MRVNKKKQRAYKKYWLGLLVHETNPTMRKIWARLIRCNPVPQPPYNGGTLNELMAQRLIGSKYGQ